MKNLTRKMMVGVCVLGLALVGAQAAPVAVGHVFNTPDASGHWLDAGSDPAYSTLSYEYENVSSNYWITPNGGGGGYVTYRFEAPAGELIDRIELGIYGWTANSYRSNCRVYINGVQHPTIVNDDYLDFDYDASLVLATPTNVVEVKISGRNDYNLGDCRVYGTKIATGSGNTREFAAHLTGPQHVFNTLDASGEWIDAGHNPDWATLSYEYDNITNSTGRWIEPLGGVGGGSATYRFQAPAGRVIDRIEMGLTGWTANSYHSNIRVYVNGVLHPTITWDDYLEFDYDASLVLATPTNVVEVKISGRNDYNLGDCRVYGTKIATGSGNTYEFAAHVPPAAGAMVIFR